MTTYPLGTCFHEAGHAVVAAALGVEVGDLHVVADADGESDAASDGGTKTGYCGHLSLTDQAAICLAGDTAQDKWHPSSDWGGSCDLAKFLKLTTDLSNEEREAIEAAGCKRALELLSKSADVVKIVASQLVQQGYLAAAEFRLLAKRM